MQGMFQFEVDRDKTSQTANNTYMDVDEAKSEGEHETFINIQFQGFTTAGPQHSLKVDPRSESIRNGVIYYLLLKRWRWGNRFTETSHDHNILHNECSTARVSNGFSYMLHNPLCSLKS